MADRAKRALFNILEILALIVCVIIVAIVFVILLLRMEFVDVLLRIFKRGDEKNSGGAAAHLARFEKEKSWLDQEPEAIFLTYRTGFRTWDIRRDGDKFVLWSAGRWKSPWPAREKLTARCLRDMNHEPPFPLCECGIYASSSMGYIKDPKNNVKRRTFLGEVKLWGVALEYSDGVRAEFAYPLNITQVRCNVCKNYIGLEKASYYYSPEYEGGVIAFCAKHDKDAVRDPAFGFEKLNPSFLSQIAEDYGITIEEGR